MALEENLNPSQSGKEFRTRHTSYLIKHIADLSLALMRLRKENHINIYLPQELTFGKNTNSAGRRKQKAYAINELSELCVWVLLQVWTQGKFGVMERKPVWEWARFTVLTHGSHHLFTTVLLCMACVWLLTLPLFLLPAQFLLFLTWCVQPCFQCRQECFCSSRFEASDSRIAQSDTIWCTDTISKAHPSWWHFPAWSDVSLWDRTFCVWLLLFLHTLLLWEYSHHNLH